MCLSFIAYMFCTLHLPIAKRRILLRKKKKYAVHRGLRAPSGINAGIFPYNPFHLSKQDKETHASGATLGRDHLLSACQRPTVIHLRFQTSPWRSTDTRNLSKFCPCENTFASTAQPFFFKRTLSQLLWGPGLFIVSLNWHLQDPACTSSSD